MSSQKFTRKQRHPAQVLVKPRAGMLEEDVHLTPNFDNSSGIFAEHFTSFALGFDGDVVRLDIGVAADGYEPPG